MFFWVEDEMKLGTVCVLHKLHWKHTGFRLTALPGLATALGLTKAPG